MRSRATPPESAVSAATAQTAAASPKASAIPPARSAPAAVLLGAGTAMVYPTLLAVIGDVAHPSWRARAVGVYRLWRDTGYVAGAIVAGALADGFGLRTALLAAAALTFASGCVVQVRMSRPSRPLPASPQAPGAR